MFSHENSSLKNKKGTRRFQNLMVFWVRIEVYIEMHIESNGSVSGLNYRLLNKIIKKSKKICKNEKLYKYYRDQSFEWLLNLLITKKINDFNKLDLEQLYYQGKLPYIFEDFKSHIFKIIKIRREINLLNNKDPLELPEIITNRFTALNIIIESKGREMLQNNLELINRILDSINVRWWKKEIPFRQISLFLSSTYLYLIGIKAREFELRQMNAFPELIKKSN